MQKEERTKKWPGGAKVDLEVKTNNKDELRLNHARQEIHQPMRTAVQKDNYHTEDPKRNSMRRIQR